MTVPEEDDRRDAIPPALKLADLMAEMPQGLPRVEGLNGMPSVGMERDRITGRRDSP